MRPQITLLNGSHLTDRNFGEIIRTLWETFMVPARVEPAALDLSCAFDNSRNQTNSTALLAQLLARHPPPSEKLIGVVDVDLFIPILTFVFGEAQLNGSAAVVSTHRLSNQFYGLARDEKLMLQRLEKEIVHELGHTFGLYHCRQFECVMRSSTYVEEIDIKRQHLCSGCAGLLQNPLMLEGSLGRRV